MTHDRILNKFTYHPPNEDHINRLKVVREEAREMAFTLNANCPASYEFDEAMKKLEEVVMWANASIVRNK